MESSDPPSSPPASSVSQEPESLSKNDKQKGKKPASPTPEELEASRISMLVQSENDDFPSVGTLDASPVVLSDLLERDRLKAARSKAINWIVNTTNRYGFVRDAAYLAAAYFDRFLSKSYNKEFFRYKGLIAAACLSIALEQMKNQPLPMDAIEKEAFRVVELLNFMKFKVLQILEHKTDLITPFYYTRYFISELSVKDPSQKLIDASRVILETLQDINLLDYPPSIIAVAAVVAVTHPEFSKQQSESIVNTFSLWERQEIKLVFPCFSFMIERLSSHNFNYYHRKYDGASCSNSNPNNDAASSSTSSPNTNAASSSTSSPNTAAASSSTSSPNNDTGSSSTSSTNADTGSSSTSSTNTDTASSSTSSTNTNTASSSTSSTNTDTASSSTSSPNTDADSDSDIISI